MRLYSLFVILVILASSCLSALAGPVADFDTTYFDMGKPVEGAKVRATFRVKNSGDADLEITKVLTSCGCTVAKVQDTTIKPGKSSTIEVLFDTTGYRYEVTKTVTVTTNDPAHQTTVLAVGGEVATIAELKPEPYIYLGNMKPGTVKLSDVTVVPTIEWPFRILRIQSNGKRASAVRFDSKKNKAGNFAVKIKVTAGTAPARFNEQLSIVTDLPGNPGIRLTVYGNVTAEPASAAGATGTARK